MDDFHFATVGVFLTWFFLTATCFRITRFITTDDLTLFVRQKVDRRYGTNSNWASLINCNWCVGTYICAIAFAIASLTMNIPLPLLQTLSAMAAVGFIGNYDD